MKKLLLFAIIIGGAVSFTSCGKDECECTIAGQTTTYTEDDVDNGQSLKDACSDANVGASILGGSCEMK